MPIRVRNLALGTSALCALAAPLSAQSVPVPPTRELIDGNGVDLFRGTYTVDQTVASIGGNQGMTYRRINRGSGWTDNVEAFIQSGANTFFVTVNGRTDRFVKSGSTYTPTEANGSTLSFSNSIYTYTSRDGTIVTFNKSLIEPYNQFGNEGLVTTIVEPNGNRVDVSYKRQRYCEYFEGDVCTGGYNYAKRISQISNAYGYTIYFSYASDVLEDGSQIFEWTTVSDRRLVNRAVDYCGPNQCTVTQNWPGDTNPNHLIDTYATTNNRITSVSRPGSNIADITIGYDASGRVSNVADHAGSTGYAYADASGIRNVTVTNALNEASIYTFLITSERLTKFKDPLNNETNYTYDGNGRLTRISRPEGNYVNTTHDVRGNVTETRAVAKPGSGAADIVATATFLATCTNPATCNRPTATTDPRGNVTDYTYDPTHGGVLTITAPAPTAGATRPQQRHAYVTQQAQVKASGGSIVGTGVNITLPSSVSQCATLASCTGGADEIKSMVTHGTNGVANNLLPSQIASGSANGALTATTALAYDVIGNLVTVDGPLAGAEDTTTAIYDNLRRPYGIIAPDPDGTGGRPRLAQRSIFAVNGDTTRTEFGTATGPSAADLAAMTVAQGVDMVYDADGRKLKDTVTGGGASYAVTQYSYDAEGRLTCAAQRMNPATWGGLPASACTLATNGSFGPDRITRTLYDPNGRVTQVQAAVGTAEAANERTLGYHPNGRLAHLIDANNNRTTYEFDGHDRPSVTRFPVPALGANVSSATDYEQYTYSVPANIMWRRLRDGQVIGHAYDNLGRLTYKDLPGGEWDVTYAYDLPGRMTAATKGPIPHSFTWDALNRQTAEGQIYGSIGRQFDLAGRLTRLTWQDGFFVDYQRRVTGELVMVRENGATSGPGLLATYYYDGLGQRVSMVRGNGAVTHYAYDTVSRLAGMTDDLAGTASDLNQTFAYNPAYQIVSVTRSNDSYAFTALLNEDVNSTPDGLNRLASVGGTAPTYDARGNMTFDPITGRSYAYWSENELVAASGGFGFGHDAFHRILDNLDNGAVTTQFVHDGVHMIAAYVPGSGLTERFVRGDGPDELIATYTGPGTTDRRWAHQDERGSVIAISDAAGNAAAINRYDEYGEPRSTNQGRLQYTGQLWLPQIGLYHYKNRNYDPRLGRFMQTDPIGYAAGPNLYAYVGNDPVNFTDPLGLDEIVVTGRIPTPRPEGAMTAEDYARQGAQWFLSNIGGLLARVNSGVSYCQNNPVVCGNADRPIVVTASKKKNDPLIAVTKSLDPFTFFKHFTHGKGEAICLSSDQFRRVTSLGRPTRPINANGPNLFDFYGTELENTFGSAFITYRAGRPIAFNDYYDFNLEGSNRSFRGQAKTIAGRLFSGTEFETRYPC